MVRAKTLVSVLLLLLLAGCGTTPAPAPEKTGNAGDIVPGDADKAKVDPSLADRYASSSRRITYVSHDGVWDSTHHVSAALYVPKGQPPPDGFPIVALGRSVPGTGPDCMSSGLGGTDTPMVARLLQAGYVVVIPDYQGFGRPLAAEPTFHPFLDSTTGAQNMVDAVHAIHNIVPHVSTKWVAMGTGQGGQAAWAANELSGSYGYATLAGTVSISPTVDVGGLIDAAVTGTLTPPQALAYIAYLNALSKEYPGDFNLADYRSGIIAENWDLLLGCQVDRAADRGAIIARAAPDDLRPATDVALAILRGYAAKTNLPQGPAKAPMFVAFGTRDLLTPGDRMQRAVRKACRFGDAITIDQADGAAVVDPAEVVRWIGGRFAGNPVSDDCLALADPGRTPPEPAAIVLPEGASRQTPNDDPAGRDRSPSLLDGWLPTAIQVLTAAAVIGAAGWRSRRWRLRWLPSAAGAGLIIAAVAYGYVGHQGWGEGTPWAMWMWIAVGGFAVAVLVLGWPRAPWWRRSLSVLAVLLAVISAAGTLNASLGYLPTVRAAWDRATGDQPSDWISESKLSAMVAGHAQPAAGTVVSIKTPQAGSGFVHRDEFVYLPPAWFGSGPRPRLPVIMMIGAEFSHPTDWLNAGDALTVLDDFAADHHGVAPVVVFPDSTGAFSNDTECVNGPRGNAADHLTKDVVPYVVSRFGVSADPANWGLLGWSTGGTCAVTLSVRHPELFGALVDLDGALGPNAGDKEQTIARLFGGDAGAWAAFDPKTVVQAHGRYQGLSAWLGVSAQTPTVHHAASTRPPDNAAVVEWDTSSEDYARTAGQLCRLLSAHGIECSVTSYAGGHSFPSAARGMADALPWIAGKIGTPGVPRIPLPGAPG